MKYPKSLLPIARSPAHVFLFVLAQASEALTYESRIVAVEYLRVCLDRMDVAVEYVLAEVLDMLTSVVLICKPPVKEICFADTEKFSF